MKNIYLLFLLLILGCKLQSNREHSYVDNLKEFNTFFRDLENNFIYLDDKKKIIECIKQEYRPYVDTLSKPYYKVLFYESILNELYDSHISLNVNTSKSYRLRSPIYLEIKSNRIFIKNVFSSQLDYPFSKNIIGSEILKFNGVDIQQMIDSFPTKCHDKKNPKIREWLVNKVFAGKRNEPRIANLQLSNGEHIDLNIDSLNLKKNPLLLESSIEDNVGIIRINNSLGNSDLVKVFNQALNNLMHTKALILDLRNTPNGGNTSIAEPIMGRFISKEEGYQICENKNERYTKKLKPKPKTYTKPLYVLAGRWTGSMGEGMIIGFDGMKRATIVGTEMNRLAGGMKTIKLLNSDFGFSVSFEKMYHLNGTLREDFVPEKYVTQENISEDEFIKYALELIKKRSQ